MDFDATTAPHDIIEALSLDADGILYELEHAGVTGTVYVRRAATAPAATARAFRVEAGDSRRFIGQTWIWTDEAAGVPVIVREAV